MLKGSVESSGSGGRGREVAERDSEPLRVPTEILFDQGGGKRSKPAATAVWVVKRLPARVTANATSKGWPSLHEVAGAFQDGEGGMSFVQVADFRLEPERPKQPPSADP